MAQEIRLNTAELLAQAGELEGIQGDFDSLLKRVDSELGMINSSWSANLARNFTGKIAVSRSWFDKLTSLLGNGAAAARYCAQNFVDTDTGLAHATSGSSSSGPVCGGGSGGGGGGSWGNPSDGQGHGGGFSGPGGTFGGGGGGTAFGLDPDAPLSEHQNITNSVMPGVDPTAGPMDSADGNLTFSDIIQKGFDGTLKQEDVSTFAEGASGGSKTIQAVVENGLSYGFATNTQAQELNTGIQQCEDLCNHYLSQGDTWQSLKYAGIGAALETAKAVTGGLNAAYDVLKNTMGVPNAIGMGEICSGLSTLGECIFNKK